MKVDARTECYEAITIFDIPMIFTCLRIDRDTVPDGLFVYEIRHDDEEGEPCQIARWILVNHYGSVLSTTPVELVESPICNNAYRDISEDDWNFEGYGLTLDEYLAEQGKGAKT